MRRTLLAFFGMAFVGYWLWTADSPRDFQASLDPVLPGLVSALPKSDLSGVRHWLVQEAVKIGRKGATSSSTVVRLKQKALSMNSRDLRVLKDTALSPTASGEERLLAVYIIGLSESGQAREFLKEIAETPLPATANERVQSDELVIRANALESVVHRLGNEESIKYLESLLQKTQDPVLAQQTRYWLSRLR
jgi:hypothetical protein